jgi:PIN domain nuclease of toxin-antitoxin system
MLLLDTHALIWVVEGDRALGRRTARLAEHALAREEIAVSAVSFWEVAVLAERRRIALDLPASEWRLRVLRLGIDEVPLTGDVAIVAATLPGFHPDPADRIITATAMATGASLVTADDRILRWPGRLERHDARR